MYNNLLKIYLLTDIIVLVYQTNQHVLIPFKIDVLPQMVSNNSFNEEFYLFKPYIILSHDTSDRKFDN